MKSIVFISLITALLTGSVRGQKSPGQLDIKLNKNIFKPGDSLFVTVDYKDGGGQLQNQDDS